MATNSSQDQIFDIAQADIRTQLPDFPLESALTTVEQKVRFELLRLAFFTLKLCKLEQQPTEWQRKVKGGAQEHEFHRSLLRHVIFQQVLTLMHLDARDQAFQIIEACR